MKMAELRSKSPEELKDLVISLKQERFNLRFQEATGALESKSRYTETRKTIARAMTLLNEKSDGTKAAKKAKPAAAKKPAAKKAKKG